MDLAGKIESILCVASKPLSLTSLAKALLAQEADVLVAINFLKEKYNREDSGINILYSGDELQMATNPANAEAIQNFVKEEAMGELTRAQLETLTVVAYRGPITRPELEQIRGVNCAVILRLLLIRGLVDEKDDAAKLGPVYTLTFEALRLLGIKSPEELPEYVALHNHENLEAVLQERNENP
jgi:segregation and condensation protein B